MHSRISQEREFARARRGFFAAVPFTMAVGALSVLAQTNPTLALAGETATASWRDQVRDVCDRTRAFVDRHFGEPGERAPKRGLYALDTTVSGRMPCTWTALDAEAAVGRRAIILVHGLDELDTVWDDLGRAMNLERVPDGVSVLRFEYPNDQSPAKSAEELDASLVSLRERGVRHVDFVCHSMGGLVTRDALTRPTLAFASTPERVPAIDLMFMAGTPNHGSALATLQWISELREQLTRWVESEDRNVRALADFGFDGKGEAARDLLPGSDYIAGLNSRPLPQGVRIVNIIGRVGTPGDNSIEEVVTAPVIKRVLGDEQARRLRDACRDMHRALGDGIVPVRSAWLDGVSESVFVEATHCGLLRGESDDAPGVRAVLDRLGFARAE